MFRERWTRKTAERDLRTGTLKCLACSILVFAQKMCMQKTRAAVLQTCKVQRRIFTGNNSMPSLGATQRS